MINFIMQKQPITHRKGTGRKELETSQFSSHMFIEKFGDDFLVSAQSFVVSLWYEKNQSIHAFLYFFSLSAVRRLRNKSNTLSVPHGTS